MTGPRPWRCWTRADEVCLACHVRPDADALGSMLAVAHALRAPGRVGRSGSSPRSATTRSRSPRSSASCPGSSLLSPPDAYPDRPELMVTFDAGSIDRLGILAGHAPRADELIVRGPSRVQHPVRHGPPDRPGGGGHGRARPAT